MSNFIEITKGQFVSKAHIVQVTKGDQGETLVYTSISVDNPTTVKETVEEFIEKHGL